jgi:hypothetical protein
MFFQMWPRLCTCDNLIVEARAKIRSGLQIVQFKGEAWIKTEQAITLETDRGILAVFATSP